MTISEDRSATFAVGLGIGAAVTGAIAAPLIGAGIGVLPIAPAALIGFVGVVRWFRVHARKRRVLLEGLMAALARRIGGPRAALPDPEGVPRLPG